jgi:plasmid stabilization system protein ParE
MRKIVWDKNAKDSFSSIIDYIREDSARNADKVLDIVFSLIENAAKFPEHSRRDLYKKDNESGRFRAFEIYSIRISFYYSDEILQVVRIRHTKQQPKKY